MTNKDDDNENKPLKVVFTEGCFDDFEGTQEELDELIASIIESVSSGELLENAVEVDEEVLELLPFLTTGNTRTGNTRQ